MRAELTRRARVWTPLAPAALTRVCIDLRQGIQSVPILNTKTMHRQTLRVLIAIACPLAARAQAPLRATPVDSTLFRGMEWRTIGPNRGGRSITAAGSASRPLEYYFGATGG